MARAKCSTEAQEQRTVMQWAKMMSYNVVELELLFHIPNGGNRDARTGYQLKLQGAKAGVPDLFLPCARCGYHGLFIEMKRRKAWSISEQQRYWIDKLNAQDYLAQVCIGADSAIQLIDAYMNERITKK